MLALLLLLLFTLLTSLIAAFGYVKYVRPGILLDQLRSISVERTEKATPHGIYSQVMSGEWLSSLGRCLPSNPTTNKFVRKRLNTAGFRSERAVDVFVGSRMILAVAGVLLAILIPHHFDKPILKLAVPVAGFSAGYAIPGFILDWLVDRRAEQIRFALADALDLLVVCCEAGCGLDQAIIHVSREFQLVHPALSEELAIVNMELVAGAPRAQALRNLGQRTALEDVKKVVAILIQTDRFGTSVAEALRTQADYMRTRRCQEAEERAGKVGVKLVFPIFFFCMPALFVVVAGPGLLQLFSNLFPAMSNVR